MAFLRADNAAVAGCQALKAGIAVPLIEAFVGFPAAGGAENGLLKAKLQARPEQGIKGYGLLA
jgi:hypothetical protein